MSKSITQFCLFCFILTVSLLLVGNVAKADLLSSQYGVDINDSGDVGFFNLFNEQFGDQLNSLGYGDFSSSNQVFDQFGLNPYTTWTTSDSSQLTAAWRGTAAFGHDLSVNGNSLFTAGAYHDAFVGILDAPITLPSGSGVNFDLEVDYTRAFPATGGNVGENVNYSLSSNPDGNVNGAFHMLALDITDLYNLKYGEQLDDVYMFLWEDWPADLYISWDWGQMNQASDFDYQDLTFIMTNLKADDPGVAATPEPATFAILGLGVLGLGMITLRQRRHKRRESSVTVSE